MKARIQMIAGVLALAGAGLFATPPPPPTGPKSPVSNTGMASGAGCIGTVTLTAGCTLAAHAAGATGWTLTTVPSGSTTPVAITSAGGSPVTNIWLADNTTSRWLRPANGTSPYTGNDSDPAGYYTWSQTFNLTAAQVGPAVFTGRFASDDEATLSINGNAVTSTIRGTSFSTWTPFTVDGGFQAGANTLSVQVRNLTLGGARGASGLRVEFATVFVPEGGEIAVLTMALGVGLFLWNRKKQTAVPVL